MNLIKQDSNHSAFHSKNLCPCVNTLSFSIHQNLNTIHANPQFPFSWDPILPVHRFKCARQVWGTERLLPPWVPVSCQTFHTVPGLLPLCPFYFSILLPSENLRLMSTPSASIRIPTAHLSSQEPCSAPSAFHYLGSSFCTLSCCSCGRGKLSKAVVGRGKLMPLTKTLLLNTFLLRMSLFRFPGIHLWCLEKRKKNLLSLFLI